MVTVNEVKTIQLHCCSCASFISMEFQSFLEDLSAGFHYGWSFPFSSQLHIINKICHLAIHSAAHKWFKMLSGIALPDMQVWGIFWRLFFVCLLCCYSCPIKTTKVVLCIHMPKLFGQYFFLDSCSRYVS